MWHACSVFDFGDTGIYTITTNHAVRLIEITLVGFWSVETAKGFVADQELAVAKLGPPYGTHLTLGDVRSFDVQQKEVATIIRDLVLNARSTSKRLALVGSVSLARMQFARITAREDSRIFDDFDEAKRWLPHG